MSDQNATLATNQLLELLLQLKKAGPAAARQILNSQPQIAYALITLMVSMNAVDFGVFHKTLAEFTPPSGSSSSSAAAAAPIHAGGPPQAQAPTAGPSAIPPHLQSSAYGKAPIPQASYPLPNSSTTPVNAYSSGYRTGDGTPPTMGPGFGANQYSSYSPPVASGSGDGSTHGGYGQRSGPPPGYGQPPSTSRYQPPSSSYPPPSSSSSYPPPSQIPGVSPSPPQAQPAAPGNVPGLEMILANIPDDQKAMIMRVVQMTPEQIRVLPVQERAGFNQLRATLGLPTG